jgi:glucose/arabinose dehydrogenase
VIAAALLALAPQQGAPDESLYYAVDYLKPPPGTLIEVGGLAFLPDGRLAVATRRGQVWIVDRPLDPDPQQAHFELFAEGLQEGLGLAVVDQHLLVLQRGELSLLFDHDRDGRCDEVRSVCNGWGLSGNYHEFAFGLPLDDELHAYIALNVGFFEPKWWHGKSRAPWRGWVLEIAPDGAIRPFASGFRSPCGISLSPAGDLFVTDNQGDWEPVGPVYHVQRGRFYGHPASLAWTARYQQTQTEPSDTVPPDVERAAPALWLPYKWSRSAGNVAWDQSEGKLGPFGGQMLISELTNGLVLRASLERVRGEWQGACLLLRQRIGSVVRLAQAADGTLVCGLTNRGWGGLSPASGVARLRWTGRTPFEVQGVHLLQDGFELRFTQPLAAAPAPTPEQFHVTQYHYDYWWQYGSPERGTTALVVRAVEPSADRTRLVLRIEHLAAGEMVRCVLPGLRSASGEPLLHDEFDYTLNQLPEGPPCRTPIARLVPPPSARTTEDEGWLRLCYGDAFERWKQSGWRLCDVDLDLSDPTRLVTGPGVGALVNEGEGTTAASDFVSREEFGDAIYAARFFLSEGSSAELWLQGRYAVLCAPPRREGEQRALRCGALAPSAHFAGRDAALDAWKGVGQWHELQVTFRAPRFDAQGAKTAPARIEGVRVDEIEVQGALALEEPSSGALSAESALGPLVIRAHGALAMGGIRVKPLAPDELTGAAPLFDGEDLEGWTATGGAEWKVDEDGVLVGSGAPGVLWTTRTDFADFELAAEVKINAGGRSALWLRAAEAVQEAGAAPAGHAIVINSSHPSPERTGSVLGLAPIAVQLVGDDTWVRLRVECQDEAEGTRLRVWLGGVLFNDVLDRERRFARGRIGFEQHHAGSVLEVRAVAIRELGR